MKPRTMLWLPAQKQGALPLCDATALALAGVLVEESDSLRPNKLAAALAIDPAFAVWAVSRFADESQPAGPLSIDLLAQWIAPQLIDLLDWRNSPAAITYSPDQNGRFAALVAESVAAGCEILRSLGSGEAAGQPAYLAALTARQREWFEACGAPEAIVPSWPLETPPASDSIASESRAAGDEAWRRWLAETPEVHALLPPLVLHLRRCGQLQTDFENRLQTAKLDSLKEFAYGAGHELNNPLANIASRAQTLLREIDPQRRWRLAAINTQAFRAHEMLADMMLFARPPRLAPEAIDLVKLADEVLAELAEDAAAQETELHSPSRREPMMLQADPVQLRVALRAMCVNSLEALGHGGNVTVEISSPGNSRFAEITIADDGPGISSEIREKIFDPFFSGREAGRGLGFGLSKCWRIVTLHGGQIIVQSQPGRGASFTITLPAHVPKPSNSLT